MWGLIDSIVGIDSLVVFEMILYPTHTKNIWNLFISQIFRYAKRLVVPDEKTVVYRRNCHNFVLQQTHTHWRRKKYLGNSVCTKVHFTPDRNERENIVLQEVLLICLRSQLSHILLSVKFLSFLCSAQVKFDTDVKDIS